MPSSALNTTLRIRRNAPKNGNIIPRADEGIGPYKSGAFIRQIPISRTMERHRAAQGKNNYTYLAHDLAARPAGKFQFPGLLRENDIQNIVYLLPHP